MAPRRASTAIADSIYVWARRNNEPVTIQDVVRCTGEAKVAVEKTVRHMGGTGPLQDPLIFIRRGFKRLNLPNDTTHQLNMIRTDLGPPMRIAIATFVAAHNLNSSITIPAVALAVGVTPQALRNYVSGNGTLKEAAL